MLFLKPFLFYSAQLYYSHRDRLEIPNFLLCQDCCPVKSTGQADKLNKEVKDFLQLFFFFCYAIWRWVLFSFACFPIIDAGSDGDHSQISYSSAFVNPL